MYTYTVVIRENPNTSMYYAAFHQDEMPAFANSPEFATVDEVKAHLAREGGDYAWQEPGDDDDGDVYAVARY